MRHEDETSMDDVDAGDELLEEVDQEEVDADAESERAFQYERSEGLLP